MLAVQTAEHLLYVPRGEIASMTPVYPKRTRVVLADGTVAHRPGQESWLNPRHLRQDGNTWIDPGGYAYPLEPLPELELELEEEASALEDEVVYLERVGRKVFWQTAAGPTPCAGTFDQCLRRYPELCLINRNQAVPLARFRKIERGPKEDFRLTLDQGTRLLIGRSRHLNIAEAIGCDTLTAIRDEDSRLLVEVRDTPYDLLHADTARLRSDFPDFRRLVLNLLWRNVLLYEQGKREDTVGSMDEIFQGPVGRLAGQLGYTLDQHLFENTFKRFVSRERLGNFRQLGFADPGPQRRRQGTRFPDTVLIAPFGQVEAAARAAERTGISCYLAQGSKRLHLEFFAQMLIDAGIHRIRLLAWSLDEKTIDWLREDLEQCEIEVVGPVQLLNDLALPLSVEPVPPPQVPLPAEVSRRVAVQMHRGLLWLEAEEIASWMPAMPSRWRVVAADGTVAYHPGPVPSGPWVRLGEGWVYPRLLRRDGSDWVDPADFRFPGLELAPAAEAPAVAAIELVRLERRCRETLWHLVDGREVTSPLDIEQAAAGCAGLVRLNHDNYFHRDCLRSSYQKNHIYQLVLDDGTVLDYRRGRYNHHLPQQLGLPDLFELEPDHQLLGHLQIRDYPYELARAKADVLKRDFASADRLIANVIWQAYCMVLSVGTVPYGDDFVAFFYRPLQATLYRAGFLTRAQMKRSPEKERLFYRFEYVLGQMVRRCRLFSYQQFGFKDANADQRVIGQRLPGVLLLVEKGGMIENFARRLQQEFGFSLLLLGGLPSLRDSEYFERELRAHYTGSLEVIPYTDFDTFGYRIGTGFCKQMEFLGRPCRSRPHLVVASCFSAEEQVLYSHPLPTGAPELVSNNINWVRDTGGVAGMALGIHANLLQPYERLRARLLEVLHGDF